MPAEIQVEAGNKLFLSVHAVGVQIYTCKPTADGYAGASPAPRADLYDDSGKLWPRTTAARRWEAKDGSKVVGRRSTAPDRRPDRDPVAAALGCLDGRGPDGDRLAGTTSSSGSRRPAASRLPPPTATRATAGTTEEVPYTADYSFWKRTGKLTSQPTTSRKEPK